MSKKKKVKNQVQAFDLWFDRPENLPKQGDLRFHQTIVEKETSNWYGFNWKRLGESQKKLQQFDGKDWRDVPFEKEWITL